MQKIEKSQRLGTNNLTLGALDAWWNDEFRDFLTRYQGVALAMSGGVDSTVLFALLCHFCKEKINLPLLVCHVNFGLRGKDSDEDQRFCEAIAKTHGVEFLGVSVSEPAPKSNVQVWARDIRRGVFSELQAKGYLVALAHQQDDLVENVLLRMARGSSLAHLLGMQELSPGVWRPLLRFSKEEILKFAMANGISFREDQSNFTTKYARNVLRLEVLPRLEKLYPNAGLRLLRAAEQGQAYCDYIAQVLKVDELDLKNGVPASFLLDLPSEVAMLVLARMLGNCSRKRKSLSERFLRRLISLLHEGDFTLELPGGSGFLFCKLGLVSLR